MHKKIILTGLVLMIFSFVFCISFFKDIAIGDDTGDPYSNKNTGTIGAWYDETWQASAFYRTKEISGNRFIYRYTTAPATTTNPTLSVEPSEDQDNLVPGANVSSDMAVTEWKVTGHVHFKSGL